VKVIKQFIQSESGAHAIEFAIVILPLLLLISGILEFGLIMYSSSLLNQITSQAARFGKTGFDYGAGGQITFTPDPSEGFIPGQTTDWYTVLPNGDVVMRSREAFIRERIRTDGAPLLREQNIAISTSESASFANGGNQQTYNAGRGGSVMVYTVTYNWPILNPLMQFIGADGNYPIVATVLVKNEAF
jgi:Flp pilus assembly pilin Flp